MGNLSADGKWLWLSGRYDGVIYAFNTDDGSVKTIPVGGMPHGLTVWPQPGRYSLGPHGQHAVALAPCGRSDGRANPHFASARGACICSSARREIDLAGLRLDVEHLDDAVDDEHRIALRAQAQAPGRQVEVEADRLGEVAVAVGEEIDMALPRLSPPPRPRAHDGR